MEESAIKSMEDADSSIQELMVGIWRNYGMPKPSISSYEEVIKLHRVTSRGLPQPASLLRSLLEILAREIDAAAELVDDKASESSAEINTEEGLRHRLAGLDAEHRHVVLMC